MSTKTQKPSYSAGMRRAYIKTRLHEAYGWVGFAKQRGGYSYRDIAYDVQQHFGLEKPVSPQTISHDIDLLRDKAAPSSRTKEARRLLLPENFPEWRAKFFTDPATGRPYETPKHQHAWFWVLRALTYKEEVPQWVLDYLGKPDEFNLAVTDPETLVTDVELAPPRHGKTELLIHGILNLTCDNPNVRIIYSSGILNTSQDNAQLMRAELEHNEELVAMYGPFKDETNQWSRQAFTVANRTVRAKSPTLLPTGTGSNILSKDADVIVVDDPQDLDRAESEATTDRDWRWLTSQVMTRREPHTALYVTGSHLPVPTGDLFTRLEENRAEIATGRHKLFFTSLKAHDYEKCRPDTDPKHENCVLWPSLRPFWFLEAQRAILGDIMFEAVYNQDAKSGSIVYFDPAIVRGPYPEPYFDDSVNRFTVPDVRRFDQIGILDRTRSWKDDPSCCHTTLPLVRALGFDPAAGESRHATESAATMLSGCRLCGRRYVIDYWHRRQSPERHADTILSFVRAFRPGRVRIEINAYQKHLAREKKLVEAQAELGFKLDEWFTDDRKNDSNLGIPVLDRRMQAGLFSVPYRHPEDREYAEDFLKSLVRWPKRPNDIPMSLWLADLSVAEVIEMLNFDVPDRTQWWDEMPPYLQDQSIVFDLSALTAE